MARRSSTARRTLTIVAWLVGLLLVLPIVALAAIMLVANTDPGRRFIEQATPRLTGGRLAVSGLSGHLPDAFHVAHLAVRDDRGEWMNVDDLALRWSPLQLLRKHAQIERLHAGNVRVLRRPVSTSSTNGLPVRVDIDRLDVDRMEIPAAIAGAAATVSIRGDAHVASLRQVDAALTMDRIDAPGSYRVDARIDPSAINARLVVDEPAGGLLSGLAHLPDLGALAIRLDIDGPRHAEAVRVSLDAGPLRASGQGSVDLVGKTLDLAVTADAPPMSPRSDLHWNAVSLRGRVQGPFSRPDASGRLQIDELSAGGGEVGSVRADVEGNQGNVTVHALLDRLRLPGPKPDLLEAQPLDVRADVRLDDPLRPVEFVVSHPLITARGHANTAVEPGGVVTVDVPALAPFAALAGVEVQGRTVVTAKVTSRDQVTSIDLDGTLAVTGGKAPLPELIGTAGKVDVSASLEGQQITVRRAQLNGKTLVASASGTSRNGALDFDWKVALSNLALLSSKVSGRIEASGRLRGPRDDLDVTADATGEVASDGFPRGPVKLSARLRGLPDAPAGRIGASGSLDNAPLQLAVTLDRASDGTLHATIERADWKSAHAEGDLTLNATDRLPHGRIDVRVARLDDLQPWIGREAQGSVAASVDLARSAGRAQARVAIDARNVAMQGSRVAHASVSGTVDDPTTHPVVALQLTADGIAANGIGGRARLRVTGPEEALELALTSDLQNLGGADLRLTSGATLNAKARQLLLTSVHAQYRGETLQLMAPARVSFDEGLAVDRLRVGIQRAVLEAAGRVSPTLDLTASARNVTPDLAKALVPDLQADGTLTMDARLAGTLAQPRGTIRVSANGLHMRTGSARSLPPASVVATAGLDNGFARVDARLSAGKQMRLNAAGRVPLSAEGSVDLHANGTVDAALANPLLEVNGRRAKGRIDVDITMRGTRAAPRIDGTVRLADGDFQDYASGVHLSKVDASIEAAGDTMKITRFTAHAGPGTVAASGTIGVFVPGRPVDIKLTGRNARPLASDLLTANMDLDLSLRGTAGTRLDLAGSIGVRRAEINIPNALPANVGVLHVVRPAQKPPPPPSPVAIVGLDLEIDAPRAVFVRGRGLDAEVGGKLHVGGTTAAPRVGGALDMRRGTFNLAGTSLKFTSGKVSFTGTGVRQRIDPTLDFQAESTANNITARLDITGFADAPKITLTSTPELPQDEILARLLFGVSVKQLSALQVAQIGAGLASLAGVGGGGVNPLMAVQKGLGLDRLSVGSAAGGGTSVEAGRYVADGVYVGAKQNTSGGTQAEVQVDLTRHLKVQATLGTGGTAQGATPDNDPGSSIGLSYQFEY